MGDVQAVIRIGEVVRGFLESQGRWPNPREVAELTGFSDAFIDNWLDDVIHDMNHPAAEL